MATLQRDTLQRGPLTRGTSWRTLPGMTIGRSFQWACVGTALFGLTPPRASAAAQLRPWTDYHVIMWVGDSASRKPEKLPLFFQRLRDLGVDTAMVYGGGDPQPLVANRFPYYVENIVNRGLCLKWNSQVRDWDAFVTQWSKDGRPESALVREYCLDDPQWRGAAAEQMRAAARQHRPHQPLAYDIRDELSVTISANPFDYDFSPAALAGFRAWLKTEYPDLAALNAEWETRFGTWDEVRPFTTDQIKNRMASGEALPRGKPDWQAVQQIKFDPAAARQVRTRWNFAPWADFRTYMDVSLARTLDELRRAAHEIDPQTPVGIEGTQMPHAFGGYDLWRLSQALDWVEPYDIGSARAIFGSFMPGQPIVTTVFENETNAARRRLWHLLLEGDRGCLIWWSEDCIDWQSRDYGLTAKAQALAPVLKEMASPLARLFLRATKVHDPIFLYYSQPSIQVDWLIESTVDGSTWLRRFSSFEADHNRMTKVRDAWVKVLQDLSYSPQFVPSFGAAQDKPAIPLRSGQALVLPTVRALADVEVQRLTELFQNGVTLLADGTPGLFDEHGRLCAQNRLESVFPLSRSEDGVNVAHPTVLPRLSKLAGDLAAYATERLAEPPKQEWAKSLEQVLREVRREVVVPLESRVRVQRYRLGDARLLAFERNIDYQMSEALKQAGGNQHLETPITLTATLAQAAHVYDLRRSVYLGRTAEIRFTLDPWQPSLFALLPETAPAESLVDSLLGKGQPQ